MKKHSDEKTYEHHPDRETIIQKDDILSLKIDLEVLSPDEIFAKYFTVEEYEK